MYTNLQVYEFRYDIMILDLKVAPSIIMLGSMGVAPILPIYSSGILPKHVFPGAIHRIKRYSYYPIIPGLSLLTGANGSSAAEKPPKYENIWET